MEPPPIAVLERAMLNALPAPRQALCGAAAVRAAAGGAGRLNGATWLDPGDGADLPARLQRIETWYARLGLPPRFRLTPLAPPALEPLLIGRGYARTGEGIVMAGALDELTLPEGPVTIAEAPDAAWFEAAGAAGLEPARLAELRALAALVLPPAAWVAVPAEGRVAAVAYVALDGAVAVLAGLATLPALRGRGLARRACLAAFGWARAEGGRCACLQVGAAKDAALSLCRRLGLREVYRCAERIRR